MRNTQVTTWPRYTKREKQAYQARLRLRRAMRLFNEAFPPNRHHFADNWGRGVPTARVDGEVL